MPDLLEKVNVIWETPGIIPYEVMVFSNKMPQSMIDLFAYLVPTIMQTDAGSAAFKTAYGIEELQPVNDAYYNDFRAYVEESRIDLSTLVR